MALPCSNVPPVVRHRLKDLIPDTVKREQLLFRLHSVSEVWLLVSRLDVKAVRKRFADSWKRIERLQKGIEAVAKTLNGTLTPDLRETLRNEYWRAWGRRNPDSEVPEPADPWADLDRIALAGQRLALAFDFISSGRKPRREGRPESLRQALANAILQELDSGGVPVRSRKWIVMRMVVQTGYPEPDDPEDMMKVARRALAVGREKRSSAREFPPGNPK